VVGDGFAEGRSVDALDHLNLVACRDGGGGEEGEGRFGQCREGGRMWKGTGGRSGRLGAGADGRAGWR
jgi:hypothetical protein